jgi:hypothetical protein
VRTKKSISSRILIEEWLVTRILHLSPFIKVSMYVSYYLWCRRLRIFSLIIFLSNAFLQGFEFANHLLQSPLNIPEHVQPHQVVWLNRFTSRCHNTFGPPTVRQQNEEETILTTFSELLPTTPTLGNIAREVGPIASPFWLKG